MHWTTIRGSQLQPSPWRNGQGTSRTILSRLGRDGALLWQVGIAELPHDVPFSSYPGHDRVFIPLAGEVALAFDGGPFVPCEPLSPRRFGGEAVVLCRIGAPGRAFNVVTDRAHQTADVKILTLQAGEAVEAPDAPEVLIHCLAGELAVAGDLLGPGDSVIGPGPAEPGAASQDSTAILVALRPL